MNWTLLHGEKDEGAGEAGEAGEEKLLIIAHSPIPNSPLFNVEVPNLLPHPAATKVLLGAELSGMGK